MARGPDPSESARDILLFMVQNPDPGFTAKEIGQEFNKTRQWADKRLKTLEKEGYVASKNPGGNAKWWWVTQSGKNHLSDTRYD